METGKSSWETNRYTFTAALVYELLGTAIVTYAFSISLKSDMIRALVYLACYLFAVHVSGAHFNPATTLAVYLTEKDNKSKNVRYTFCAMLMQLIGAYIGILVSFLLLKDYSVTQLGA